MHRLCVQPFRLSAPSDTVRPAVEGPERRCFCIDVTCDNLLDAVKQTVEEETAKLRQRRETELALHLREAIFEEQQLAGKAGRFECELKWKAKSDKHDVYTFDSYSKTYKASEISPWGVPAVSK